MIRKGKRKRLVSLGMSLVLVLSLIYTSQSTAVKADTYELNNPVISDGVSTWDCVYFGNYYQSSSQEKEPIKWRVLSVSGDDALLLSDKILDKCRYHEENTGITWDDCDLREWINGSFFNEAFNTEEKEAIILTEVVNGENPYSHRPGCENTNDMVYIPSVSEIEKPAYGFLENFWSESDSRFTKATDYSKEKGVYSVDKENAAQEKYVDNSFYWLRTSGTGLSSMAHMISPSGTGGEIFVTSDNYGVRPMLHLDISQESVWTHAGTVNSNNETTEWKEPAEGLELNGYILNNKVGGMRGVYTVTDTIDGKAVVESGLLYGVADYAEESDVYVGSTSEYVASFAANEDAPSAHNYSHELTTGTSYRMTLKFAKSNVKELTSNWYIRAYAKLEDNTYVYSDVRTYNILEVIEYLYQHKMMPTEVEHNDLYTNYLSVVDANYEQVPYGN